jgi:hypothetical protein
MFTTRGPCDRNTPASLRLLVLQPQPPYGVEQIAGPGLMGRLLAAQVLRALLMSVVLYPLQGPIGELSFELRALLLGGLMSRSPVRGRGTRAARASRSVG